MTFSLEPFFCCRNIDGLKDCFKSHLRTINADQPLNDIFTQAQSYATTTARSVAPRTPRIVILGPSGCGRKTVATQVARKYDIPIGRTCTQRRHVGENGSCSLLVSISTLIKQQILSKTPAGLSMKPYVARQALGESICVIALLFTVLLLRKQQQPLVPDSLLMPVIRDRLNQKDCIGKGWIMIGFPRTREQAESLARIPLMAPTR